MKGRCGTCDWFGVCGGGFRTRAAFVSDDYFGSDPACYLRGGEIGKVERTLA